MVYIPLGYDAMSLLLGHFDPWRRCHCAVLKWKELITKRHSVISKKNGNLSYTAA